ncbi:SIR2 family protein [Lentzea sp. HUAS TT2]|uniref:SIR2 family protein n=1 Tax=Lentzea sp. HUAS TT2 TaxID=3447454 RepID=UPI003F6EFBAA
MRRTFIVGAGASVAPPAGLPLFFALRSYLVEQLELPPDAVNGAAQLAPETFMRALHEGGLPLELWLTRTLRQGHPNALHTVLATALASGDRVWTVNVDELIEAASSKPLKVAAYDSVAPDADAVLLKPHGTVSSGRYIFRSDQVVRPLPPAWAQRLVDDCAGRHVVVIGYAGLDVDMRLVLDGAFAGAAEITWFATTSDRDGLMRRLPLLGKVGNFLGGDRPNTLSPAFLAWADGQGLTGGVTPYQREAVERRDDRLPAHLGGDVRLARALLLERIGDRAGAREELLRILVPRLPALRYRVKVAAARLRTIDLYGEASWTKPLLAIAASRIAWVLPRTLRQRLDRVHVTLLSSSRGLHTAARRRARRALDKDDPAILLCTAKAARFTGDLATSVADATKAADLARIAGDVDLLAHALFERAFAHMWAGELTQARSLVRDLHSGVDGLAGVRWIAWACWQQACLHLYDNRPQDAITELERAEGLFALERLPAGEAASITVQLTARRMMCDGAEFERLHRDRLTKLRGSAGWTAYTDASIALELAEWARTHGDPGEAERLYDEVVESSSDEPVHRTFAMLGLAELERAAGRDNSALADEIREVLRQHPMAYIEAHLVVTDFLAGRVGATDGLAYIAAAAPNLTTRTGFPPRDPSDYCLGAHPELHEIYLP